MTFSSLREHKKYAAQWRYLHVSVGKRICPYCRTLGVVAQVCSQCGAPHFPDQYVANAYPAYYNYPAMLPS